MELMMKDGREEMRRRIFEARPARGKWKISSPRLAPSWKPKEGRKGPPAAARPAIPGLMSDQSPHPRGHPRDAWTP